MSVLTKITLSLSPGGSRFPESTQRAGVKALRKDLAGALPPREPGSRLQVLQVLWQRVLLDILLDVPAREMGLQVLLHHEVQSSLTDGQRERSVPTECILGSWGPSPHTSQAIPSCSTWR